MAVLASLPVELLRSVSRLGQSIYFMEKIAPLPGTQLPAHPERDQPVFVEHSSLGSRGDFHNIPLEGVAVLRGSAAGVFSPGARQFLLRTLDCRNVSSHRSTSLYREFGPSCRVLLPNEPSLHPGAQALRPMAIWREETALESC